MKRNSDTKAELKKELELLSLLQLEKKEAYAVVNDTGLSYSDIFNRKKGLKKIQSKINSTIKSINKLKQEL